MRNNPFEAEAYMDDFSLITVVINKEVHSTPSITLHLTDNTFYPLAIQRQESYHQKLVFKCITPVKLDVSKEYWVEVYGSRIPVKTGSIVRTAEFDASFSVDSPLGSFYMDGLTTFKVWSPVANQMLLIYRRVNENTVHEVPMERSERGVWTCRLTGNHHLTEYMYKAKVNHEWIVAPDPYARSVTVNGEKSVVLNMYQTDPEKWDRSEKKMNLRSKMETLIYEVHVRDFTIHPHSGVTHKGKYLGLSETGTKTPQGFCTGLDYLKNLGISHVQLMPVADFGSIDETRAAEQYNWGYDPVHFFSPEGSYATNPHDPVCRVKELKMLIQALHNNGLSVILDVVYNHVYKIEDSAFEKLVPGYFFRYDEGGKPVNGTGVGNDTASERKMMQKYIIDALTYWLTEYKVDGFRFDLMGIHDIDTMSIAAKKLKKLNPGVFLLGEGWDLSTNLVSEMKASLSAAKKLPDYSFFNDTFRDSVKGSIFPGGKSGFINGNRDPGILNQVIRSFNGCAGTDDTFLSPVQSINYTECHDNHTLHDLLFIRHPGEKDELRKKRQQLALAFTLFSRGVPFIHAGQEIFRTKFGTENSYNSSDKINALNWDEFKRNEKSVQYFRELIHIRKEQPVFHGISNPRFPRKYHSNGLFGVEIELPLADKKEKEVYWRKVLLLFNSSLKRMKITLPPDSWFIAIADEKAVFNEVAAEFCILNPLSFSLLYQN